MIRLLLCVAIPLALTPLVRGQEQEEIRTLPYNGTEFFRGILEKNGVRALQSIEDLRNQPAETDGLPQGEPIRTGRGVILIIIGLPKDPANDPMKLADLSSRILEEGGAVLIASENPASLAEYLPDRTPLSIVGERAYVPRETSCYAGKGWFPFLKPVASPFFVGTSESQSWFSDYPRVTTNRTSGFSRGPGFRRSMIHPVGRISNLARIGGPDGQPWPDDRYVVYAGAGPRNTPYRCALFADTSLFLNLTLALPNPDDPTRLGSDNLQYSEALVDWLRGPERRSVCLFIENGEVVNHLDDVKSIFPPDDAGLPNIMPNLRMLEQKLVEGANRAIASIEDRDKINRAITGPPDSPWYNRLLQFLAVGGAVVLAGWLLQRSWSNRYSAEGVRPPTASPPSGTAAAPAGLTDRERELSQAADLSRPIREYVRLIFANQGLPVGQVTRKMPRVEVTGPGAPQLRQDLRDLWNLAFFGEGKPINFARWKEMEPMIEAVRRAADRGRWRFATPEGAA